MTERDPAERVRERIRQWMHTADLSQRDFATDLKKSQVWLKKVLAGTISVRLKDLDTVASAMRTTAAELVRSDDNRYQLELTPTEIRILEGLRRRPEAYESIAWLVRAAKDKPHNRPKGRPMLKVEGQK